jgi:hypothetical protein
VERRFYIGTFCNMSIVGSGSEIDFERFGVV